MAAVLIILSWLVSCHAQFLDQYQGYDQSCLGEDRFQCEDGTCIPQEQYCDGRTNCVDNSDESFCPEYKPDPTLCKSETHFLCADEKRCIPNIWLCNRLTDCDDGSDESNCTDAVEPVQNGPCKGFRCDKSQCISQVWICDGIYDCKDKSDESQEICKEHVGRLKYIDMDRCLGVQIPKHYRCIDSSYCLPAEMMCNGMPDCRDGSDETDFCKTWNTACSSNPCQGGATCVQERFGFSCICPDLGLQAYNYTTNKCGEIDECAEAKPNCSHICINLPEHYKCDCEDGYAIDESGHLCHARGPEPLLFYSTKRDIGYIKIKSKQKVTLATGVIQAHGVSSDGKYIYWVETAQGHQAIMRAQIDNVDATTEVLVGLGLEDPGDIALDWIGGHIYFSDAGRGIIAACRTDGSICTTLPARTKSPRFVTLDVKKGNMYWCDWEAAPVIMSARMDGGHSMTMVDQLASFATGLTLDAPNGRLYYVDRTIYAVRIDTKQVYSLFKDPYNHPYAIAVFENTVYWSDWTSRSIQTIDKLVHNKDLRRQLIAIDSPVFDMHIYHPVLVSRTSNPCSTHHCSHLCLVNSTETYSCACPDGMQLGNDSKTCQNVKGFRPLYLVVGSGPAFTRIQYNTLGNPEMHSTHFNISSVNAMAYEPTRDTIYIYDGQRKEISSLIMADFNLGLTHPVLSSGLVDVIGLDYDYASDNLYILDAGRRLVEVFSLRNKQRALVYRFRDEEEPISFCVLTEYGRMLFAVQNNVYTFDIQIDSIGLDGSDRLPFIMNDLAGPNIRLGYSRDVESVFIADEGNNVIDFMNPLGAGRERFRLLSTSVRGLAVTGTYVFWTNRQTPRLFWANVHDTSQRIRSIDFSIFPNNTQLHIQAASFAPHPKNILLKHPCRISHPCSDICVQTPHTFLPRPAHKRYKCFCPPSLLMVNGTCSKLKICNFDKEFYCHKGNDCVLKTQRCDGNKDCTLGEDEEGCDVHEIDRVEESKQCPENKISCNGECIDNQYVCRPRKKYNIDPTLNPCPGDRYHCKDTGICIDRSRVCDSNPDCPDSIDEDPAFCQTWKCLESEFTCLSGECVHDTFLCDGEPDCNDGSDEIHCSIKKCSLGHFQCKNGQCIDIERMCDGVPDCKDKSDEHQCTDNSTIDKDKVVEPKCTEEEHACKYNKSICIPATARCNKKADCPGSSDELDCDDLCAPHGLFQCRQELKCLTKDLLCNNKEECNDGSDEFPEACMLVNRTSLVYPPAILPPEQCQHGYLCRNGQCVERRQVCNKVFDCLDQSDEGGQCENACKNNRCEFNCISTPNGPHCVCPHGYYLDSDLRNCLDIDECANDVCPQQCQNVEGSYLCSCYRGYAIRSDHRSCKAVGVNMTIVYAVGYSLLTRSANDAVSRLYDDSADFYDIMHDIRFRTGSSDRAHNEHPTDIADIDADISREYTYLTFPASPKLVVLGGRSNKATALTRIGSPTKVAVDWITGNVYFADEGVNTCMRVCNMDTQTCAKLQKIALPSGAKVTALVVDPSSGRMFYCISHGQEATVWSAALSGRYVQDHVVLRSCTGLTVDSFGRKLFIAEDKPVQISRMDIYGDSHSLKKVIFNQPYREAPNSLVIYEDWIYFLERHNRRLVRCMLYGRKSCKTFIAPFSHVASFIIKHNSIQRDDIANKCIGFDCSHLCVVDVMGPVCLCNDGTAAVYGKCPPMNENELPQFNGWTHLAHHKLKRTLYIVFGVILGIIVISIAFYIYYRLTKKRQVQDRSYFQVTFHNTASPSDTPTDSYPPSIPTPIAPPSSPASAAFEEQTPSTSSQGDLQPCTSHGHGHGNPFSALRHMWKPTNWMKKSCAAPVMEEDEPSLPQEPYCDEVSGTDIAVPDDRQKIISVGDPYI